ncbi:hypothetical protein [Gloeobacter morelensis]|uniref:Uncharacterized protein n=1 Tax=Gloeobacter morelensis MG652769 TaxID=2781736 RepID=A0ABY3PRT6_9CYAN|nr:hypothetical protein [Gloeobacter morelensis]UFP96157.1 hypothetical protein ISF26_08105 [Gloeobacter morelensis MG652769]
MQKRCERNRRRTQPGGRRIKCPVHGCYAASVSQKRPLYYDVATGPAPQRTWLEAFWCTECQQSTWYQVRKLDNHHELSPVAPGVWQRTTGTADPSRGNPSVSQFTQREANRLRNRRCDGHDLYTLA